MKPNPYEAPKQAGRQTSDLSADPAKVKKIEAIIRDGEQYLVAILMCVFCSLLGLAIIAPWYTIRLVQWNQLASADPRLVDPSAPKGSTAYRFRQVRLNFIVGIAFGVIICGAFIGLYIWMNNP